MPRPIKCRQVQNLPTTTFFKPAGIPLRNLVEVTLSVEEVEAVRLKDKEGLEQEQCAQRMNVSRTTFGRVINSARKKIAMALLDGKAIRIEGGNFRLALKHFVCANGHQWQASSGGDSSKLPISCPSCNNKDIRVVDNHSLPGRFRHGRAH